MCHYDVIQLSTVSPTRMDTLEVYVMNEYRARNGPFLSPVAPDCILSSLEDVM